MAWRPFPPALTPLHASHPHPHHVPDLTPPDRGRDLRRAAADHALDALHLPAVAARGLARLASAVRRRWERTPRDRRGPALFAVATCLLVLWLTPYGPLLGAVALAGAAIRQGRDRPSDTAGGEPGEAERARLQTLYEALVPHLSLTDDPRPQPLYAHDGDWRRAFTDFAFTEEGRLARLRLRYPPHFGDGDPEARAHLQELLCAKAGRGREYHFAWEEEVGELTLTALPPLPAGVCAQRFVTAPGETVLGFTDLHTVRRTVPVVDEGGERRDVPPVVWRTGPRSTEPHLLALGHPGSGTTTLLRSIALQALRQGEVLVVDGGGAGEYAFLAGRGRVAAVESTPAGALSALEWVVRETERRLLAANRVRQTGRDAPEDVCRPLWVLVDRPSVLSHLARAEGQRDPQDLLQVPLRYGRAVRVTVALADQFEGAGELTGAVRAYTRARVVLGAATPQEVRAVLGEAPSTTPPPEVPPGRGYARLGSGPVHRLQVPAAPDPFDEEAAEPQRRAVLELLPEPVAGPPKAPARRAVR
ncbi:hypothetical protein SAMN05216481_102413 [Streptomyces radiopugnans]|uniref:FtsK domain-containing protein n=1 Tax=Streptomyces radiopugnans TaxID=403935 RepID=A0A1H9BIQ5_9ACTN|nr:hypothetical protein SAMN05216481_102413 [Streptomyces radiopugnans]